MRERNKNSRDSKRASAPKGRRDRSKDAAKPREAGSRSPKRDEAKRNVASKNPKSFSSKTLDRKEGRKDQKSPHSYENKKMGTKETVIEEKKSYRTSKPRFRKTTLTPPRVERDPESDEIRLNKYLSNSGVCSRREADQLILSGVVKVNGVIVTALGTRIKPSDTIVFGGQRISHERKVYILLNKPKDYITTSKDPQNRKTVLHLIENACKERVYPVGRLDRQTTGVLLLTNDGDLTRKLTHPSSGVKKVYHVELDQNFNKEHFQKLLQGIELEDGISKVDQISYVEGATSKKEIGVEIHSGKNRIVRRMMEALGYKVVRLDRVLFADLTKKGLTRGKFRFLNEKEVSFLRRL